MFKFFDRIIFLVNHSNIFWCTHRKIYLTKTEKEKNHLKSKIPNIKPLLMKNIRKRDMSIMHKSSSTIINIIQASSTKGQFQFQENHI
jgi:hypothetical protein